MVSDVVMGPSVRRSSLGHLFASLDAIQYVAGSQDLLQK